MKTLLSSTHIAGQDKNSLNTRTVSSGAETMSVKTMTSANTLHTTVSQRSSKSLQLIGNLLKHSDLTNKDIVAGLLADGIDVKDFSIPSEIPTSLPDNVDEEFLSDDEEEEDVDEGVGFTSNLDDDDGLPSISTDHEDYDSNLTVVYESQEIGSTHKKEDALSKSLHNSTETTDIDLLKDSTQPNFYRNCRILLQPPSWQLTQSLHQKVSIMSCPSLQLMMKHNVMDPIILLLRFKCLSLIIFEISNQMWLTTKHQTKAPRQIHQHTAVSLVVRVNIPMWGLSRKLGL